MKLKSTILAAATLTVLAAPQAEACSQDQEVAAIALIFSVTSAPTGTSMMASCRDEILNLKEAAVAYRMSGKMSPVLQSSIDAIQKEQGHSAETIIDRLVNAKLEAE